MQNVQPARRRPEKGRSYLLRKRYFGSQFAGGLQVEMIGMFSVAPSRVGLAGGTSHQNNPDYVCARHRGSGNSLLMTNRAKSG
jgi:hypothetical protein